MRRPGTTLLVLITLLIGFFFLEEVVSLLARFTKTRAEVGRVHLQRLSPALTERLESLRDDVLITYYVTSRDSMPSHMRRVERDVISLLDAMKNVAGEQLEYHLVDPTDNEDLELFASKRSVFPVRARQVSRDQYSEREIWSSLSIEYGPERPATIQGITGEHLPRLQEMVLESFQQLEDPRPPTFALITPDAGYADLRAWLSTRGTVRDLSADLDQGIAEDVDVLLWVDPGPVGEQALRHVRNFIDSGRGVLVAGQLYRHALVNVGGESALELSRVEGGLADLLPAFGLRPVPGLLLDANSRTVTLPTGQAVAPFEIACLAMNQDFQSLVREPRGTILFSAPTPLSLDADILEEQRWRADVLATSSDGSTLLELASDGDTLALSELATMPGLEVAKQPLLVWLKNEDPWRGSLMVAGDATLFGDVHFETKKLAQRRLAEVLIDTLTTPDRLAVARSGGHRSRPLPVQSRGDRILWRLLVVFLFPALLLSWMLLRHFRGSRGPRRSRGRAQRAGRGWQGSAFVRLFVSMLLLCCLVHFIQGIGWSADMTREGLNELSEDSRSIARSMGANEVVATLYFSDRQKVPPGMRGVAGDVRASLRQFQRDGADIKITRVIPEDLGDSERSILLDGGILPVTLASQDDETTTVRTFFSTLVLSVNGRQEDLVLRSLDSLDNLEFRIAFALWRLKTGRQVHIGFASDIPRLSSAEAYQIYQNKGLIPPQGKDVYSLARQLLEDVDFRVTHINPREPAIPPDLDALVWIQPRRSVTPMLSAFVDYLYRGGRGLIASQHFVMQSRQYRGTGFDFVYWPQPQSPDVEEWYFPDLGVNLVREVLFDEMNLRVELDSQVNLLSRREFKPMALAKPFLIRALATHHDLSSTVTRNLGDQAFLFGNHFVLDAERLDELDLDATVLMTTSPRAWSYNWAGGWLPEELLGEAPGPEAGGLDVTHLERAPIAILLEGQFPWPQTAFERLALQYGPGGVVTEEAEPVPYPVQEPKEAAAPGRLLFIGSSEMFKDERLLTLGPEYRPDHLLLNAVGDLALKPDLARIMTRREAPKGFDRVEAESRFWWRGVVLLSMPIALLLVYLCRALFRRRHVLQPAREGV